MDPTNRNTALASALAEELARSGVSRAVICPGSRSTPLALALLREPGIETVSVVDERSAGFAALGMALASRTPVAITCTSGTAAANFHPAVAEASEASVPLVVLTADRPPELRGVGAGQTIDQIGLYGSAARWFCEVGTQEADDAGLLHVRSVACRAVATATGEARPGPVHLNLSFRDPLGPDPRPGDVTATSPLALEGRAPLPLTQVHRSEAAPAADELGQIAALITAAPRGLIVTGRQPDPALAPAVAALAVASGYPILAEPTSQIRFGTHDRSRVVDAYDSILREPPEALEPDLVVRFGDMPTSKALRTWLGGLDQVRTLVVDPAATWNEPTRKATAAIRAEPEPFARDLAQRVGPREDDTWLGAWQAAGAAATEAVREATGEPSVHVGLAGLYRDGDLVFTASSMPIRDQEAFALGSDADVLFCSNRGANGIDGTISAAIGAALASGRPAWTVLGDLALHHDSNGLALLRHLETPMRIVCINNDGGGIFEFLPQASQVSREEFEAIFGTPLDLDIASLCAANGIRHVLVDGSSEITADVDSHTLFEVRTDRRENVEAHRVIAEAVADAVRQALAG